MSMPQAPRRNAELAPEHPAQAAVPDACELLEREHHALRSLFAAFAAIAGSRTRPALRQRRLLASQICDQLTVHAQVAERVFYPALGSVIGAKERLAESEVERGLVSGLVASITDHAEVDLAFDAKIKVLQHCVLHHFEEEQRTLFPLARASLRLDLAALGAQLATHRGALMAQARAAEEVAAQQRQREADAARLARNAHKRQKYQAKVLRSR